jgi:hypothetical protein
MCEMCKNCKHITWLSKCKMRWEKKQKTKLVYQNRFRLYFVNESQIVLNSFKFVIDSLTTSFTNLFTNLKIIFSCWKIIKLKKNITIFWNQTHFLNFHRFHNKSTSKKHDNFMWQKLVSEQRDYKFEKHKKDIVLQFNESISICKLIVDEYK